MPETDAVGAADAPEDAVGAPTPPEEPEEPVGAPEEPEPAPEPPSDREREAVSRLLASAVARNGESLADAADLLAFCDEASLLDDEGWPDDVKIRAAAEALADARPHLAARKFSDVGQGARKASPPEVGLADILRSAAR